MKKGEPNWDADKYTLRMIYRECGTKCGIFFFFGFFIIINKCIRGYNVIAVYCFGFM